MKTGVNRGIKGRSDGLRISHVGVGATFCLVLLVGCTIGVDGFSPKLPSINRVTPSTVDTTTTATTTTSSSLFAKKKKKGGGGGGGGGYGSGGGGGQRPQEKQSVKEARFDAATRQFMFTMVGLSKIPPDKSKKILDNIVS